MDYDTWLKYIKERPDKYGWLIPKYNNLDYQKGWDACKEECLKIIAKHEKATHWSGLDWEQQEYIKKIKKL